MGKNKNQKGFTLIEILIVMVLIGLVVAVMIGIFGGITGLSDKAKADKYVEIARQVASAVQRYNVEKGGYPTSINDLITNGYLSAAKIKVDSDDLGICPAGTSSYVDIYEPSSSSGTAFSFAGDAGLSDGYIELKCISKSICKAIDDKVTSIGIKAVVQGTKDQSSVWDSSKYQCFLVRNSSGSDLYYALFYLYDID